MTGTHRTAPRGQTLIEFALLLPILLMFLMGVFEVGRVVLANDMVSNAAREGARFAIVHGGSEITACPVGPYDGTPPAPTADCPYPSPSKQAIREVGQRWAIAAGHSVTVEVCYGDGCSGDTDIAGATNVRGTPVTVTVRSTVTLVMPSLLGLGSFDVSSSSTMLVNH